MKILAISGGRKDSNNDALCMAALAAAENEGAEVVFVRLQSLNIDYCRGCFACGASLAKNAISKCVIKDDFDWLREQMLEADGIVFSMPVYRLGAPAKFLSVIERFGIRDDIGTYIALEEKGLVQDRRMLRPHPLVFLGTGGTDLTPRFEADCRLFSTVTMWPTINCELFTWTKSVFAEPEKLEKAARYGKQLVEAIKNEDYSDRSEAAGLCPFCHSDNFRVTDRSDMVECSTCGVRLYISADDGKYQVHRCPEETHTVSFAKVEGKLQHTLDVSNNNKKRAELMKTESVQNEKKKYAGLYPELKP